MTGLLRALPGERPRAVTVVSAEADASGWKRTGQTGFRRTTRLGPAREASFNEAAGQGRSTIDAQRGPSALARVTHTPSKEERALSSSSAPDAAAPPHPAPRIVTIAKRPSEWSGTERNIVLYGAFVKIYSDVLN